MFDDEKIQLIEAMPEADAILVIWVKLLIQAGKTNANGFILLSENIPYSPEMLSTIFRRPLPIIKFALKVLSDLGMIEMDTRNVINVTNWEKHQNIEGLDKIREQNKLRQAKHRESKSLKNAQNLIYSNVTVTQSNATVIEIDKDKELKKHSVDYFESLYTEYFLEFVNLLPTDVWEKWVDYRKETKHKLTKMTAEAQLKKLLKLNQQGHKPIDIINQSIENGWQGLFEVKSGIKGSSTTGAKPDELAGIVARRFNKEQEQT